MPTVQCPAAHLGLHMPYYVAAAAATGCARPLLQHRPDAPCTRRASSPEILHRLRRALRELCPAQYRRPAARKACSSDDASSSRLICLYDPASGFIDQQPLLPGCVSL